jgi:hypothetical protein
MDVFLKISTIFSYILIIIGSLGMMVFVTKFSFITPIENSQLTNERFLNLNGYQVWRGSWICIIFGTVIQLIYFIYDKFEGVKSCIIPN